MAALLTWSPWTRVAHPDSWQTELTVEGVRLRLDRAADERHREIVSAIQALKG